MRYTLTSLNAVCHAYRVCRTSDADLKKAGGGTYAIMRAFLDLREGR